ncbi:natural killer cells antigen CD94 [Diceros bicornis minor]|uniref:natural killer cells antigen CD94 n=1 Tax=Diceros bicornis minor TaxID=77932 RepID=UPI0026ECF353|nr:natural killer cells antigen CD94 [Diceros bicornis minor]
MAAFQTTPWRLISGILGVMCILLMATLGILLKNSFTQQSIQSTVSPELDTELQQGSGCCSCPERWIGYQCNCYFVSNELKTWADSKDFCVSQNSSLLQMQNADELRFMNSSKSFYWIGLSYSEEHGAWLWEDGSVLSQDLFQFSLTANPRKCIMYSPSKSVLDENCHSTNRYICKQRPT